MYNIHIIKTILKIYANSYDITGENADVFVKPTNALTKAQEELDNFMVCNHKNDKEDVIDYHFHLLKNYGYINGIINGNVKITEKGQELYDLLEDERLNHNKTALPLMQSPLSVYHKKLLESLNTILKKTYNGE